jgi:hypothetical protein
MTDVDRIAPPTPTLPSPVGRSVGKRRQTPRGRRERGPDTEPKPPNPDQPPAPPDHIDEYV